MTDLPKRVFIVEDEVVVAFEMTDTLEDLGFEVVGPSVHLSDAEKKAETANIDVAFLDVNLGRGKTSAPVAKILRERSIPFAFITAYDAEHISFMEPTDKVVKKPVSSPELLTVLRNVWAGTGT
ncbi:response regulator [Jannaschia sp. CCS1]|uniref:response regulator n=1 Tax=Jannaschia sp. (strain CCS1) TaxID=290400 RepID=UPI000053BA9A|nr:response regulator [Jannaschia sp. CCS1]ABD54986.1 response regulator receiver domain protein (CheY-like) [Jannaschia sp. CCS1]